MKLTAQQNDAVERARTDCRVKLNALTDDHMERIRGACYLPEHECAAAIALSRDEYMLHHNAIFAELRKKLNEIIPTAQQGEP
jgi:hypothetical protein